MKKKFELLLLMAAGVLLGRNRDRKVKSDLWETLHTSIYNYEKRTLQIGVREGSVYYNFEM